MQVHLVIRNVLFSFCVWLSSDLTFCNKYFFFYVICEKDFAHFTLMTQITSVALLTQAALLALLYCTI